MTRSAINRFRIPLEISSWLVFAISVALYWITADPGASYWDCPEYVTTASRLEIGHPPGNPVWMLAMRVALIPFPPESHAYVINLCSGLLMAFASFFLCRIIFMATRVSIGTGRILPDFSDRNRNLISCVIAGGSALCFSFCDSAWFSAVEAEVYAMSAMLTSASLWIMTQWWFEPERARRIRLLILLAYLTGLSLGVHQLNLLCIPVYLLIVLYRKNPGRISFIRLFTWIVAGGLLIVFILYGLMPGLLKWASMYELLLVNGFGFPFDAGVIAFILLLFMMLISALVLSRKSRAYGVESALWMLAFVLLGYSSFAMIMIRSQASPFMNEGTPDDIFSLSSYIARDQYPSTPLLYGHTPYSRPMLEETFKDSVPTYVRYALKKGIPVYIKSAVGARLTPRSPFLTREDTLENKKIMLRNPGGYLLSDYRFTQVLTPELNLWFPRITSRNTGYRDAYADWAGMTEETMDRVAISTALDSLGNPVSKMDFSGERNQEYSFRPTYGQNLRYFLTYQSFYMYFRYLLWNFMGRQNDYPSTGEIDHGNFITGFSFIDDPMLGNLKDTPAEISLENPGRNNYFSIPFLFGVLGIIWLLFKKRRSRRTLTVITLFFFMTGLAIVIYLNQTPAEPRERDYSFLGSYMAFVMFMAAGFYSVALWFSRILPSKINIWFIFLVSLFPATLMAVENFDDHDRRNRFETTFYASSFLDFEEPAIMFTHGDNSTFPAWYASEVLEMGKDITPVDVTYMSVPSYIVNLQKQTKKGLKLMAGPEDLAYGRYDFVAIRDEVENEPLPLKDALERLYCTLEKEPYFPASKVSIRGLQGDTVTLNIRDITGGSGYLTLRQLVLLDLIANAGCQQPRRALYFPLHIDRKLYQGFKPVLWPALFGKVYAPYLTEAEAQDLMKKGVDRELEKLTRLNLKEHYADPVTADRTRRYRGEMIIAANQLTEWGDSVRAGRIVEAIQTYFPYNILSAGDFTVEDSTYYEGKEYIGLLDRLYKVTSNSYFKDIAETETERMNQRRLEWLRYYESLTPQQRKTLSNRSKRRLL